MYVVIICWSCPVLNVVFVFLSYNKKFSRSPDPINAHLSPDRHFGSVSEQLSQHIDAFIDSNAHSSLDTDSEEQG